MMFNIKKANKSLLIAAAAGILGLASLGFYNTATAIIAKHNQSTVNEVAAATVTTDADNGQISITSCPGDCAACGLCTDQQIVQSDEITSNQISEVEIY